MSSHLLHGWRALYVSRSLSPQGFELHGVRQCCSPPLPFTSRGVGGGGVSRWRSSRWRSQSTSTLPTAPPGAVVSGGVLLVSVRAALSAGRSRWLGRRRVILTWLVAMGVGVV